VVSAGEVSAAATEEEVEAQAAQNQIRKKKKQ
jgi:multidrug efflux pump subunit AcrB